MDRNDLVWRMPHNPNSKDPERCNCFSRAKSYFYSEKIEQLVVPQVFASDEAELLAIIAKLPGEWEELHSKNPTQTNQIVTKERIMRIWKHWKMTHEMLPKAAALYGDSHKLARRFALHLKAFMDIEAFIKSRAKVLVFLEDDVKLLDSFLQELRTILSKLPSSWDCFNFIVPRESEERFRPSLRLPNSNLSINYQFFPAACLLISKAGAKKYLYDMLFEPLNCPPGDPNHFMAIDCKLSNQVLNEPYNDDLFHWSLSYEPDRRYQTFTFVPGEKSSIQLLSLSSTW